MPERRNSEAYRTIARGLATQFASRAAEWDQTRTYPWINVSDLVDANLMGMTIPKKWGGQGASYFETVLVIEEIARACTLSARSLLTAHAKPS